MRTLCLWNSLRSSAVCFPLASGGRGPSMVTSWVLCCPYRLGAVTDVGYCVDQELHWSRASGTCAREMIGPSPGREPQSQDRCYQFKVVLVVHAQQPHLSGGEVRSINSLWSAKHVEVWGTPCWGMRYTNTQEAETGVCEFKISLAT